jgi:hypothetical protein
MTEFAGSSSAQFGLQGYLSNQPSAGVNPASTGGDIVVAIYNVPANLLDQAGRQLNISAAGGYAANGNTKQVKIFVGATAPAVGSAVSGGTKIADSAAVATNGAGWKLSASIAKYGAAGSNTQIGLHNGAQNGSAGAALLTPAALTLSENLGTNIVVTANATTTATDIALNLFSVEMVN